MLELYKFPYQPLLMYVTQQNTATSHSKKFQHSEQPIDLSIKVFLASTKLVLKRSSRFNCFEGLYHIIHQIYDKKWWCIIMFQQFGTLHMGIFTFFNVTIPQKENKFCINHYCWSCNSQHQWPPNMTTIPISFSTSHSRETYHGTSIIKIYKARSSLSLLQTKNSKRQAWRSCNS